MDAILANICMWIVIKKNGTNGPRSFFNEKKIVQVRVKIEVNLFDGVTYVKKLIMQKLSLIV